MLSMPTAPGQRARRSHLRLLASCALAAIIALPSVARGQAFQGTPTTAAGSVSYNRGTAGHETITVGSSSAIIDWAPSDTGTGGGTIDFLPAGHTANYTGRTSYTVLNRIMPEDPSRAVGLNGTINSTIGAARGGTVWFYSPGGIVVGSSATFNIGSLLLTADNILSVPGGKSIQFQGDANSRSSVVVQPGAQINALNEGSYVALVAPRVSQGGTVRVNGTANYIAAEAADVTISGNLFDIQVTTGSYVDPSIPGDGVTLRHTGTTSGPASLGSGDPHLVMMMAVPKNDAVTMLVGGTVGFEAASNASIENGVVVLSAGSNIRTVFNGGGSFQVGVEFNYGSGLNSDLTLTDGSFTSRVVGVATNDVTASGNLDFAKKLDVTAGQDVRFSAGPGSLIEVGGDLTFQSLGLDTGLHAIPGTLSLAANGGTVRVTGNAKLDASGIDYQIGSVAGGTAGIDGTNGTVSIGGDLTLLADALPGYGDAAGGTAAIAMTGGSLTVGGKLLLSAEADGGIATGGTASILADGARITVTDSITASVTGTGRADNNVLALAGSPGDAQGGTVSIGTSGAGPAAITAAGTTLSASATGAEGQGYTDGGNATGGSITVEAGAGNLNLGNLTADASATGGRGSDGFGGGYRGGSASGGTIDIFADGGSLTVGDLSFNVSGFGGDGGDAFETGYGAPTGGDGGFGMGGQASFRALNGGRASADTLSIQASGAGGDGGNGRGGDGLAGTGQGGSIALSTIGGAIEVRGDSVDLLATGTTGVGVMLAGEGGAEGRGGMILVSATDGTIGAGQGSSGFALTADASGFGGASTQTAGNGGTGVGGRITVQTDGSGAGLPPGRIETASLNLIADGRGGDATGPARTRPQTSGNGGNGTGGIIAIDAASGRIGSGAVTISARGLGGDSFSGGTGGTGLGGTVDFTAGGGSAGSGMIALGDVLVDARGLGGGPGESNIGNADGGIGQGGRITLAVAEGSITATNFDADAGGLGGAGHFSGPNNPGGADGGRGGDGRGGTISITLAQSPNGGNSLSLGTAASLRAAGLGGDGGDGSSSGVGGAGGDGFGGSIGFSDADPLVLAFNVDGTGGTGGDGVSGGVGGAGTGGSITLSSFGGSMLVDSALFSANGLGGAGGAGLAGDGGAGGTGNGGLIDLFASGQGTLTINALSASAVATGGKGGDSLADGDGGVGGAAAGGSIGFTAEGEATFTVTAATSVAANAVGGAGGAGSSGLSGGDGGDGGAATGGAITLLASSDGLLSIGNDPHSGLIFDAGATGGSGGIGGDASAFHQAAGDGGVGGTGDGGFISVSASGGHLVLGDASLLVNGGGGGGGAGGAGTGGDDDDNSQTPPVPPINGAAGSSGYGTGGQVIVTVADDNELGLPGSAQLGSITISANGDAAGFIDIIDRADDPAGSLIFANLTASAAGAPAARGENLHVYSESGAIQVQGSASLSTGGSALFEFADTGGLVVGGDLVVTTGQRIDISHSNQPGTPVDSIHAGSAAFQAGTAFSAAPGSIIQTDNDLSVVALGGPVDAAILRAGGTMTVQGLQAITISEAHALGDIALMSQTGSILVSDIASGGLVDADGTAISLTAFGGLAIGTARASSGDIMIAAAGPLSVNSADAAGALSLQTTSGSLTAQSLQAGQTATISAPDGIDIDMLHAGGDIDLDAVGGAVLVRSDIASGGLVDASGTAVTLNALGDLHVGSVTSTAGDIALFAATLAVDQAQAAGNATFFAGNDVSIGIARAAGDMAIQSGGTATLLGTVEAGSALSVDTQALVTIAGTANGGTIRIASPDIAVGDAAVIGSGGTSLITLSNNAFGTLTTIGGAGGGDGYVLDKGEFSRFHAQNITIASGASPNGRALGASDVRIEDLDIVGPNGANANITSATGALTIQSAGALRVAGDVRFMNAADGNQLALSAGDRLDVITPDGSISLTGSNNALSGQLLLTADTIFVGTLQAEQDLAALTDTAARNDRLGQNDGLDNAAGYIQAGALEFTPVQALYIQNSGQNGTTPDTRGGFTARSVTITTPADGTQSDIVINGRLLNADGSFTTGKAIIPLIAIRRAGIDQPSDQPGSYTLGSKANNCLIAGGDCQDVVANPSPPPLPPAQDIVKVVNGDTPIGGLTPYLEQTAIQMIDLDPYAVMPDIDDPVTGAGNDDLWSAACPGTGCAPR